MTEAAGCPLGSSGLLKGAFDVNFVPETAVLTRYSGRLTSLPS
jgi:hypothetical protein